MVQFQHTHGWITDVSPNTGEPKTHTRRIKRECESVLRDRYGIITAVYGDNINYWEVGKDYAIQPGRGKHSVGRFRVLAIGYEDVRDISDFDVNAEGFASRLQFLETWVSMHDKHVQLYRPYLQNEDKAFVRHNGKAVQDTHWRYTVWELPTETAKRREATRITNDAGGGLTDAQVMLELLRRPDELYAGWVIEFELVKD